MHTFHKVQFQSKDLRHSDVTKVIALLCTLLLMTSICDGPRMRMRKFKSPCIKSARIASLLQEYNTTINRLHHAFLCNNIVCTVRHQNFLFIRVTITLTPTYLYCEFAFRAHFQCVVRTYDLKCVENANQLVSTQGKIMNIHMRSEALVR